MKKSIAASVLTLGVLYSSPSAANPQDAINTGTQDSESLFDKALTKGAKKVIKKAATKVFGKIIGFGIGEMLDSTSLNENEDEAVKKMNEEWEKQQEGKQAE